MSENNELTPTQCAVWTQILDLWKKNPWSRFGQLVYNLMADNLFSLPDEALIERINKVLETGQFPSFERKQESDIIFEGECEKERLEHLEELLKEMAEHGEDLKKTQERFGWDSKPMYSVYDRVSLDMQTFYEVIVTSPSIVLDQEGFRRAKEIFDKMHDLYQYLAVKDFETGGGKVDQGEHEVICAAD